MARPSPGAQRIIALLNFFADNPGRAFSLTDLIRALRINRSTLHSLLAELVEANYLFRTSDKLYVLGSTVARLGQVASKHLSPLQVAHPEMRAIADEFDTVCSALFKERGDVVVRDRAAAASRHDWYSDPTYRWPLRLPLGPMFFVWAPRAELEAWFETLSTSVSEEDRRRVLDGLEFVRARGFQFTIWQEERDRRSAERSPIDTPHDRRPVAETRLERDECYGLASLTAPIRDASGRVAFVLSLSGFASDRTGAEIAVMGERLGQASQRITQFLGGSLA